jgi:tetratricopeptide (TPR) repeat protein
MKRNLKYAIGISSSVIFLLLKTSNYVQLWRGDSSSAAIATFAVCFLLFLVAAGYVAYSTVESKIVGVSKSPRYPRLHKTAALVLWGFPTALVMVSLALLVFQEPQKKPGELIILVAQFQGPHPETYRVTEHFLTALETSVGASDSITIRGLSRTISPQEGSEVARKIGLSENADFVIWGWYGPTETDAVVDVHSESLMPEDSRLQLSKSTYTFYDASSEFNSFRTQQRLSSITTAGVLFIAGNIRYSQHDYPKALKLFDEVERNVNAGQLVELKPSAILFYLRGNSLMFTGKKMEAIHEYDRAANEDSAIVRLYNNRATCYVELGFLDKALEDLNRALSIDSTYLFAYGNRAAVLARIGRNSDALRDINCFLSMRPHDASGLNNRAAIYSNLKNFPKALKDIREAIRLSPNNQRLQANLGVIYMNQGYLDSALVEFNKALEHGPLQAHVVLNRGRAYSNLGNYRRAIADYDRALELDSALLEIYESRGVAYQKVGEDRKAIEDFSSYIRRGGKESSVFLNRGVSYSRIGVLDRALADFSSSIAIKPTYESAYRNRAELLLALGRYRDAIKDYTKVLSTDSTDAHSHSHRGTAYVQRGYTSAAMQDWATAIRLNPTDGETYYNRGYAFMNLGQMQHAADDFKKALEYSKDSTVTRYATKYLRRITKTH